ncbi:rhomboid family intramembrane serine protease [Planctomycetota bacterium]
MGSFLWTPALKYIMIITVVCFLIQIYFEDRGYSQSFRTVFELVPALVRGGHIWQLLTYGLLHNGFGHIFWNMFILWMFGKDVEQALGKERFVALYVLSIVVAGVCSCILASHASVVGASGGVFAVLVAFGMLFPKRIVLFMFFIPMPARIAVFLFILIAFWAGGGGEHTAHFAHLGGLAFGYLFVKTRPRWEKYLAGIALSNPQELEEDDGSDVTLEEEVEMDRLLGKIKNEGLHKLTWREKRFLDQISQRLRNR